MMNTACTKHMLLFVAYVLAKVNNMNVEFQAENFRIHKMHSSIVNEYRCLLGLFVREDVLISNCISDIDPRDQNLWKPLKSIELGGRCQSQLIRQPLGDKETQFRQDAVTFLVELCTQIREHFPLSDNIVIAQLSIMDVKVALNVDTRNRPSIIPLAINFANVVPEAKLDELLDEWNELPHFRHSLEHMLDSEPPIFWNYIKTLKDGNDKLKFGNLADLMCVLLVLSHSSACVKRVFSQLNVVKTERSNRLLCDTMANRLLAKQAVTKDANCYTWKSSKTLLEDVMEGRCYQRYANQQLKRSQDSTITTFTTDDVIDSVESADC